MTQAELRAEALERAQNGMSAINYPAIFQGFLAKGIAEDDIKPRENVLTFHAWKAVGRSVKKGEHGVRVTTMIPNKITDPVTGEERVEGVRPTTAVVFHVSQTEPTADAEARWNARKASGERGGSYRGYRRGGWRSAGYHAERRHAEQAADVRDPGEDAADRWNETHGDRWIEE